MHVLRLSFQLLKSSFWGEASDRPWVAAKDVWFSLSLREMQRWGLSSGDKRLFHTKLNQHYIVLQIFFFRLLCAAGQALCELSRVSSQLLLQ